MELRHLKYFIAVAEELNFRRAAERLHMEQPPLSRQIRQLEEELSVELFLRSTQGVFLTEAGQAFLGEARLTLAQAERSAQVAKQFNDVQRKKLTIGFSICVFDRLLAQIVQTFRETSPEVAIELKEMHTTPQIKALLSGEIDVGFVFLPVDQPDILTEVVLHESLVIALPEAHPLASLPTIPLSLLADEPFIIFPRSVRPDFYDLIIRLCQQAGFQPKIVQEATPPEVAVSFVEAGAGVSLMAAGAKKRHSAGVVYRALGESTPYLDIAVAWHRRRSIAIVNQFLDVVKQKHVQTEVCKDVVIQGAER
jgi:DNA-binding transcriptional LysR family regulator